MPWRETCRMDEKLDFVLAWHRGEAPMTALCAAYGISRKTGYKWLGRYCEAGPGGLAERSRAPRRHGRAMAPAVAAGDCGVAPGAPVLGSPEASRGADARASGDRVACGEHDGGASALGGSCARRRLRRRLPSPERPFRAAAGPNDVWCIDFKGLVPDRRRGAVRSVDDHRRVEPLPSCGGDRAAAHRSGRGGGRGGLPALRSAAGAALGQWNALCQHGRGRSVAPVGALGEGGDRTGADRSGAAAAERSSRADAPDPEDGDGKAAGGQRCGATGAFRPLPGGVQRLASARGVGPGAAGGVLPPLAASLARAGGTGLRTPGTRRAGCAATAASSGAARRSS